MWAQASLFRNLLIQTYTEPLLLKYGELATTYPWLYRILIFFTTLRECAVCCWQVGRCSDDRWQRVRCLYVDGETSDAADARLSGTLTS